jgi:copper(I)-binding protein
MSRLVVVAMLGVVSCGRVGEAPLASARGIDIVSGYAFPSINGGMAAYLTLRNTGAAADTVLDFTSPQAGAVMAHRTITEGGASRMEMLDLLPVGAGETVTMAPGGLHLMLESVQGEFKPGDTLAVVARMSRAGPLTARLPVRPFGEVP